MKRIARNTNNTNKIISLLLVCAMLACMAALSACAGEKLVIKAGDTFIVINASADAMGDSTEMTLLEYMEILKADGELDFEISAGMITSINGIDNPADFSSCWMLYTSDAENSNASWGTVEYKEKEYASAMYGAETLKIKQGCTYVWVYKSF